MTERVINKTCDLCGQICINNQRGIGRWIGFWSTTFIPRRIEDCEIRTSILKGEQEPGEYATEIVYIPGKIL